MDDSAPDPWADRGAVTPRTVTVADGGGWRILSCRVDPDAALWRPERYAGVTRGDLVGPGWVAYTSWSEAKLRMGFPKRTTVAEVVGDGSAEYRVDPGLPWETRNAVAPLTDLPRFFSLVLAPPADPAHPFRARLRELVPHAEVFGMTVGITGSRTATLLRLPIGADAAVVTELVLADIGSSLFEPVVIVVRDTEPPNVTRAVQAALPAPTDAGPRTVEVAAGEGWRILSCLARDDLPLWIAEHPTVERYDEWELGSSVIAYTSRDTALRFDTGEPTLSSLRRVRELGREVGFTIDAGTQWESGGSGGLLREFPTSLRLQSAGADMLFDGAMRFQASWNGGRAMLIRLAPGTDLDAAVRRFLDGAGTSLFIPILLVDSAKEPRVVSDALNRAADPFGRRSN